jgi:hypothetical protein
MAFLKKLGILIRKELTSQGELLLESGSFCL